jgi:flagellar export protein FliJ
MNPRRRRIERVVAHRGKELDKRVAELGAHRAREEEARRAAANEREKLQHASEGRLKLTGATLTASSWIEANEWLKSRAKSAEVADKQAFKAGQTTQRARAQVLHAHSDLKKVEVLSTRIESEERVKQERVERRLEDEIAAALSGTQRSRGEP